MKLAMDNNIRKIAFPSISTGVYHFPVQEAAKIAVSTVKSFIDEHPDSFEEVYFVLFDDRTEMVYSIEVDSIYKS